MCTCTCTVYIIYSSTTTMCLYENGIYFAHKHTPSHRLFVYYNKTNILVHILVGCCVRQTQRAFVCACLLTCTMCIVSEYILYIYISVTIFSFSLFVSVALASDAVRLFPCMFCRMYSMLLRREEHGRCLVICFN